MSVFQVQNGLIEFGEMLHGWYVDTDNVWRCNWHNLEDLCGHNTKSIKLHVCCVSLLAFLKCRISQHVALHVFVCHSTSESADRCSRHITWKICCWKMSQNHTFDFLPSLYRTLRTITFLKLGKISAICITVPNLLHDKLWGAEIMWWYVLKAKEILFQ
jgi:hypothetical protein